MRAPDKPPLAEVPEVVSQLAQKPLAVRSFIVQNGPAWSSVTRRATALDRAQIGRLSRIIGRYPGGRSLGAARRVDARSAKSRQSTQHYFDQH